MASSMRRTQSVRTYSTPRNSLTLSQNPDPTSTDLSVLREADESSLSGIFNATSTIEDNLRKQLLEKDRENDKLQTTILSLQTQLAARPPIDTIQSLEKEYKNLDLLLQGTQRENERCMAELERARIRERTLEQALAKLAGEHWQTVLDIGPSPTTNVVARTIGSSLLNRGMVASSQGVDNALPTPAASQASIEATLSQMEQIRLLVLGMEQRMQEREQKLSKTIEHAEAQEVRCEALRKDAKMAA